MQINTQKHRWTPCIGHIGAIADQSMKPSHLRLHPTTHVICSLEFGTVRHCLWRMRSQTGTDHRLFHMTTEYEHRSSGISIKKTKTNHACVVPAVQTSFRLNVFNMTTSSRRTPSETSLHVSSHLCHMACFLLREQEQHFLLLSAGRAHINRQTIERKQADIRLSACSEEQSRLKPTVQTNC